MSFHHRLRRTIGIIGFVASGSLLALNVMAITSGDPAGAVNDFAGILAVREPSGLNPALKTSGAAADEFTLTPPASDNACSGDTASDGYQVNGFILSSDQDPTTLVFDTIFGVADGAGVRRGLPKGTGFAIGASAASEPLGLVTDNGPFNLGLWSASDLPEGDYLIGLACAFENNTIIDKFWYAEFTITHDAGDPGGFTWTVNASTATTTTTTTTVATTTTTTGATTTTTTGATTTTTAGVTTTTTTAAATTTTVATQVGGAQQTNDQLALTGPTEATPVLAFFAAMMVIFGRMAILGSRPIEVLPAEDS
ncbi:MAG: hypothetical protein AAF081_18185 [Actinomycetota bacterium]